MPDDMLDTNGVKVYPIKGRKNIVRIEQFAKVPKPSGGIAAFFDSLPDILCAAHLKDVIRAIVTAHKNGRKIGVAVGAHVVKCGLAPVIIDLMERGIITCIAMNGSVAIHDYEVSLIGETSEDVADGIEDGSFGMAWETGDALRIAASSGFRDNTGMGRALGDKILNDNNGYQRFSILAACARLGIPATVHVAIGTDTVHMHPGVSGSDLGGASHIDFRKMASFISRLEGGVWLNIGSAVVMPEVFLKALTLANNLGHNVRNFTTVNMDMMRQYRAETNVVKRPTRTGYSLIGHHEIMLPLLHAGIVSMLDTRC